MKISKEKMVVLIAEAISETIGLDHSNRGREEPLGKTGPVVEEEEKEMTEEEFMDWLHDMIERPGADPDYSRAMTFLGNLLDFKEVLDFWNINSKEELKNVIGNYMSMQENSDLMKEYEQEEYYKTVNGVTYRCVRNDEGDEDCYPLGGGKRRRYEEVKQAVREALKEEQDKGNPWAICTASVGRDDKAKYERCVQDVKKETGYKD